jgi:hypothetical protein
MEDYPGVDQSPAQVRQGLEALKGMQSSVEAQNNEREAIDERLQKAKAKQREFVIRLYVTSASVIVVLSLAIYLTIRLS